MQAFSNTPAEGDLAESDTKELPGPLELLKRAWPLYKERFGLYISILALPVGFAIMLALLFPGGFEGARTFPLFYPSFLFLTVIQIIATIAVLFAVVSKEDLSMPDAYRKGLEHFFSYLWIAILSGIIVFAGFLLLIIPGIIFSVWFSLVFLVFVKEGKRGFDTLSASRAYVQGHWWAVFGRILFLILIGIGSVAFLAALMVIFSFIPGVTLFLADVSGALFSLFFTPFSFIYMYLLYQALSSKQDP